MKFDLKVTHEEKQSPAVPYSVVVTQEMREDIKAIKRKSEDHKRMVNYLSKQFFALMIEKFQNGELDAAIEVERQKQIG